MAVNTIFKGKKVIVTGASRGIGEAIALEFLRTGAEVIGISSSPPINSSLVSDKRFQHIICDLRNVEDVLQLPSRFAENFEGIDILVNNAGIKVRGDFLSSDMEAWEDTMAVNLRAPYFLTQAIAKGMTKRRNGIVVNIASQAGIGHVSSSIEYGLSKAGLIYLTKSLAKVLAPYDIRVNAVSPGRTYTSLTDYKNNKAKELEAKAGIPLGRINTPNEVAKVVLFLSSDEAKNITGEVLAVDGGECIN